MKSNFISNCLTFYVLPEPCHAEPVVFTVVNGLWFSSRKEIKKRMEGKKNTTNTALPTV